MQKIRFTQTLAVSAAIIATIGFQTAKANAQAATAPKTPAPLLGTWNIDPVHTNVNFTIGHLGLSTVQGRFDTVAGTIVADKDDLSKSSVQFTIQVASVNTDFPARDSDLKSANYFDAADYPTITFQSTSISKTSTGYLAVGNLTIHGITRVVRLPFTLEGPIIDPWGNSRIGIETHTVISRLDYKVGGNDQLLDGSFAIGKDATVDISLEATPAPPAAKM